LRLSSCPAGHPPPPCRHRNDKNRAGRHCKFSENLSKLRPGGVSEALVGCLGIISAPRIARKGNRVENRLRAPPRDPVWKPNSHMLSILAVCFPIVVFLIVLGGLWVEFALDLGRFFTDHFRCVSHFPMSSGCLEQSFYSVIYSSLGMLASWKIQGET
jgi:hypothetical protein